MSTVAVYGSVNWDDICRLDRYPGLHEKLEALAIEGALGGSAANTATWLASLMDGVELIGAVGKDAHGSRCYDWLAACGVGTGGVEVINQAPTSRAFCWIVGDDKRIVTHRDPRLRRDHAPAPALAVASSCRHLHLGSLVDGAARDCLAAATAAGATVSIELSGKPHDEVREHADVVFLNTVELHSLFGLAGEELSRAHAAVIAPKRGATAVVTDGSRQVICVTHTGVARFPVTPLPRVVDRTGGGDAFDAGFIAAWLARHELAPAISSGLACARSALSQVGGSRRPV